MTTSHSLSLAQQSVLRNAARTAAARPMAAWEVDSGIDVEAIRARYDELTQAQPILRSAIGGRGRRAKLEIADHVSAPVVIEADMPPDSAFAAHLEELLSVSTPPAEEPLVTVAVVRGAERTLLAVSGSPIVVDDAALDSLAAALLDDTKPLDYLQNSEVSAQLAQWTAGTPATDYWADRLADAPVAGEIGGPRDRFVRAVTPERWADVGHAVGQQDHRAVLAALVASSMVSAGHAADVVVGVAVADRAGVLGPDTNYLPLRLRVADTDTPATLSAQAKERLRELTEHSDVRGEWLHHRYATEGRLFDIVISVDEDARGGVVDRIVFRPESVGRVVRLELSDDAAALCVETGIGPSGDLPTAERLAAALVRRGRRWIASPDASLADIADEATNDDGSDADGWPGQLTAGGPEGPLGGELETVKELVLGEAIRSVLGLSADAPIGRGDTFFSLGGDSVGALKVVTAVGQRGYAIDVESVFTHPEITEIAARMTEGDSSEGTEPQSVAALSASGLDPAALAALSGEFADDTRTR